MNLSHIGTWMEIALIFGQKWNHQEDGERNEVGANRVLVACPNPARSGAALAPIVKLVQHLRWLCIFCSGSVPHNHREKYFVLGKTTNKNKNILF
jgi:hypothetical protein